MQHPGREKQLPAPHNPRGLRREFEKRGSGSSSRLSHSGATITHRNWYAITYSSVGIRSVLPPIPNSLYILDCTGRSGVYSKYRARGGRAWNAMRRTTLGKKARGGALNRGSENGLMPLFGAVAIGSYPSLHRIYIAAHPQVYRLSISRLENELFLVSPSHLAATRVIDGSRRGDG